MRITDFLADYLTDVRRVVEWHAGSLSVEQYVRLADGVSYERRVPGRNSLDDVAGAAGVLLIGIIGPDPRRHGPENDAYELLGSVGAGSRCAVLLGYPTPALPVHRLLDALGDVGGQLLQLSSLEHEFLHSAAMIGRPPAGIAVPRDPFGEPIGGGEGDEADEAALRRLANEFVLLDFASRHHRAELFRLTQRSVTSPVAGTVSAAAASIAGASVGGPATAAPAAGRAAAGAFQADVQAARAAADQALNEAQKLEKRLQAATAQEARLREQVERLERSTSYRLGRLLVDTARRPTRVPGIPGELVALWRQRGATAPSSPRPPARAPAPSATAAAPDGGMAAPIGAAEERTSERRFLAHTALAVAPRTVPVVAAIVTEPTAGSLDPHAVLNRLGPNDARLLVERSEPDILLVEAAAFGPGQPWAFGSDPAGLERTRLLTRLIDQVHVDGRVAVLARDRRSVLAAGLVPIESRFDVVLDAQASDDGPGWSRGVQLARFNPIGASDARDPAPIFVGSVDPRAPVPQRRFAERVLTELRERGLERWRAAEEVDDVGDGAYGGPSTTAGTVRWRDAGDLYRSRRVAVANPVTVPGRSRVVDPGTLEQLACGTRVVSGPNAGLGAALADHVSFVDDPEAFPAAITGALEQPSHEATTLRPLLRLLFERHASAVMLTAVTGRLASVPNPLAGRSVTVVASASDPADWPDVAASLVDQAHRPAEVILLAADPSEPEAAANALTAAGIATGVLPREEITWADVAAVAAGEWISLWPAAGRPDACHLLDLVVAADMVGAPPPAAWPGAGGALPRDIGADGVAYGDDDSFRYVQAVEPARALVRRTAVLRVLGHAPVTPVGRAIPAAGSDGARWLAIGPEGGS